jgi:ferredoxin-thioredoxin reductase catalytic subunit
MIPAPDLTPDAVEALYRDLLDDAGRAGYYLNPDKEFTKDLVRSLMINEQRYGYQACPCRLAAGSLSEDNDIICPCDYRDADLGEFGACYCGLYVSGDIHGGRKPLRPIPERRPAEEERAAPKVEPGGRLTAGEPGLPVWRCRVCGYLCAREEPPEVCPICKAKHDRFERFM